MLIKSITKPYIILSIKFPVMPEKIKDKRNIKNNELNFNLKKYIKIIKIAIIERVIKKYLPFGKIPKIPPLLSTLSNFKKSYNTFILSPYFIFFITKFFDILSKSIKIKEKLKK